MERARGGLGSALRARREVGDGRVGPVVIGLAGGRGALVRRSAARRLVTTVEPEDAASPAGGLAGWLERLQARRSAVLVVPDRATGVSLALRWRLDPQRFRLAGSFDLSDQHAGGARPEAVAWHRRG